jgi:hypothetical protein
MLCQSVEQKLTPHSWRKAANMEIQIIYPTLEDYSNKVHCLATKYGQDTWLEFTVDSSMMGEDDRDEFAFIYSALGDQLISREFDIMSGSLKSEDLINEDLEKPGFTPGFAAFAGVELGRQRVRRIN